MKKRFLTAAGIAIIIVAAAVLSCGKGANESGPAGPVQTLDEEQYTVSGYVSESITGHKLGGVYIEFWDHDTCLGRTMSFSGAQMGYYSFELGVGEAYHIITVKATKYGYYPYEGSFIYDILPSYTYNFAMFPGDIEEQPQE